MNQFDILEKSSRDGSSQFEYWLYLDFKLILVGLKAFDLRSGGLDWVGSDQDNLTFWKKKIRSSQIEFISNQINLSG
jgi:hypothetical protein